MSIPQSDLEMQVADGPHWQPEIGEYEVILFGEPIAWATTLEQAQRSYLESLGCYSEHIKRNPKNGEV